MPRSAVQDEFVHPNSQFRVSLGKWTFCRRMKNLSGLSLGQVTHMPKCTRPTGLQEFVLTDSHFKESSLQSDSYTNEFVLTNAESKDSILQFCLVCPISSISQTARKTLYNYPSSVLSQRIIKLEAAGIYCTVTARPRRLQDTITEQGGFLGKQW